MISLQAILDEPETARFIKKKGKGIAIDWEEIKKIDPLQHQQNQPQPQPDVALYNHIMTQLLVLGVLSPSCRNHFALIRLGSILNPIMNMQELFFTSKEDAQKYHKAYGYTNVVRIGTYDFRGVLFI